jgi:hypothetical protein
MWGVSGGSFIGNLRGFSVRAGLALSLDGLNDAHDDGDYEGESASDGCESHSGFVDADSV